LSIFQSRDAGDNICIGSFTSCTEWRSIFEEGGNEEIREGDKAKTDDGVSRLTELKKLLQYCRGLFSDMSNNYDANSKSNVD
jgi:hypothetical protein